MYFGIANIQKIIESEGIAVKASEGKLSDLLGKSEKQFIIPIYQRRYKWTRKSVQKLFEDIMETNPSEEKTHFLNSIVYSEIEDDSSLASKQTGRVRRYHVVDGQQRLTTFSLLLIAIRDLIKEHFSRKELKGKVSEEIEESFQMEAERIEDLYLINKYVKNIDLRSKLKLSEEDHEVYIKLLFNGTLSNDDKNSLLFKNYQFLKNLVKNYIDFTKIETLNSFLEKVELGLDIIDTFLEKNDDPQKIFSSLNSTGESLKDYELVKNFLLMHLDEDTQKEFYQTLWMPMEENISEKNLTEFLQVFLTMRLDRNITKTQIYSTFEKLYSILPGTKEQKSRNILEELNFFSGVYKDLFLSDADFSSTVSSLRFLDIKSYYPLFLLVKDLFPNIIEDVAKVVESYLVARLVVGLPPGKTKNVFPKVTKYLKLLKRLENALVKLSKSEFDENSLQEIIELRENRELMNLLGEYIFSTLGDLIEKKDKDSKKVIVEDLLKKLTNSKIVINVIKKVLKAETGQSRFPSKEEITSTLPSIPIYSNNVQGTKYILYKIEKEKNRRARTSTVPFEDLEIEHILPQTEYSKLPDCWAKEFPDISVFEKYVNVIGNLTLIKREMNAALGNKCFNEKLEFYRYDNIQLNREIAKESEWTPETINNRTKNLIDVMLQIWNWD